MNNIVITYSATTKATANLLYESFSPHYKDNLILGLDGFITSDHNRDLLLQQAISNTRALIVLIGDDWLADEWIKDENHPMRLAIKHAQIQKKRIIVVLVENASMPTVKELPFTFVPIFLENIPLKLREAHFVDDLHRIKNEIDEINGSSTPKPHPIDSIYVSDTYPSNQNVAEPADWWQRFLAYQIDIGVMLCLILLVSMLIGVGITATVGENARISITETEQLGNIIKAIAFIIPFAYLIISVAISGQTIGKAIMRIRVVRADGNKVGWGGAFLRNLILMIVQGYLVIFSPPISDINNINTDSMSSEMMCLTAVILLLFFADYLTMFSDSYHQTLHDKLAKTIVICNPSQQPQEANLEHQTSSGKIAGLELADINQRLIAFVIDIVLIVGAILLLDFVIAQQINQVNISSNYEKILYMFEKVGLFMLSLAYFIVPVAINGQTVGKVIMKIRIVNPNGDTVGMIGAVRRYLIVSIVLATIFILSFTGIESSDISIFGAIDALIFTSSYTSMSKDSERQGWHDKIAQTVVIKKR